ncbi:MAG: type II toxin-antitoxin system VapC family toxin [Deltaproteobacteria bacterium]|nr:type II toxin-antitoxin system VapC family toxin [Deltaproteobacteria bacterium]
MKFLLLDTCTFLWLIKGDDALPSKVITAFVDPNNEVYLSAVSAWEINVKYKLGRLPLPLQPDRFIPKERKRHFIFSLNLSEQDTLHLCKLPTPHKDPFDRMLVCQAIEHSMTILTPDPLITQYPIRCLW